ncbi:hypothetical protein [Achromobacter phage Motura]|uniref:Uncharacterized protein n=1 Tax=Achromobacter phage Motura TaxID=2591403 RepID=A0A514CT94_9CAUD|nr:hypothetical protein H1O15_gp266 [Achromobacter phage Motura]QDH83695.1 hypothetical protein [Achromobacter phage Motura]
MISFQDKSLDEILELAHIGQIALRFVDRAGDHDPQHDPAERICDEFSKAVADFTHEQRQVRMRETMEHGQVWRVSFRTFHRTAVIEVDRFNDFGITFRFYDWFRQPQLPEALQHGSRVRYSWEEVELLGQLTGEEGEDWSL